MKAWAITLRRQVVDTVHYEESVTAEFIKSQLIARDGFDPEIEVIPAFVGFTPEEEEWWENTILDGHRNRHLNTRG